MKKEKINFMLVPLVILGVFLLQQKVKAVDFQVQVTIQGSCTFTATNLTFPATYNPTTGANNTATATFNTTCTNLTNYHIDFTSGGSGDFASRRMTTGSNNLTYNLYIDSNYATIWGDGTGGSTRYDSSQNYTGNPSTTGDGTQKNTTVYGRIFPAIQATAPAGTYTDTITATLTVP